MKAVILGGTFNPIHYGHLFVAEDVRSCFGYETAIFVPANIPVHKDASPVIAAEDRLGMLRLAIEGYRGLQVDDCEIRRGGPSYSIDTIEELVARHRIEGKPGFIIGDDLLAGFPQWKDAERLSRTVDLFVARRTLADPVRFDYPHRDVMNMILPVSSSEIRKRIAEGRAVRFLLPDRVIAYIEDKNLYG